MGYDVYLGMDTGNGETADAFDCNYTYNCSGMWAAAGMRLTEWDGKLARDMIPALRSVIAEMVKPERRAEFEAMNPKNGWGSFESSVPWFRNLLEACEKHPLCTVRIT